MKCQTDTGLKITVDAEEITDVSPKIKDNLYRIYQETMTNVIKHAGASEVIITLKEKDKILSLEVKDNGKGFVYQKKDGRYQGIGLSTIQERVDLLNGILIVESSPLKGTAIRIEVSTK
jgi:signal transduction histidine kinase